MATYQLQMQCKVAAECKNGGWMMGARHGRDVCALNDEENACWFSK